eukprot:1160550-Pelagomonas_calceolata.AAC.4
MFDPLSQGHPTAAHFHPLQYHAPFPHAVVEQSHTIMLAPYVVPLSQGHATAAHAHPLLFSHLPAQLVGLSPGGRLRRWLRPWGSHPTACPAQASHAARIEVNQMWDREEGE